MGDKKLKFFPISNSQIDDILKRKLGRQYIGCFARNDLPKTLINGSYVINLDDKFSSGTHWTCMKVTDKEILYFDSFGFICPNEIIERKNDRDIFYSTHEIQNIKSVGCGFYCIYFLCELHKNRDKVDILLEFENNNNIHNDKILKKWFNKNF